MACCAEAFPWRPQRRCQRTLTMPRRHFWLCLSCLSYLTCTFPNCEGCLLQVLRLVFDVHSPCPVCRVSLGVKGFEAFQAEHTFIGHAGLSQFWLFGQE